MYDIINDRVFWVYFIISLFFIIIGIGSIIVSNDPYMILLSIIWLLANVILMILVYHASTEWGPDDSTICVVDSGSKCFEANNRVWLFINVLFIAMLIISVLWAAELGNPDSGPLRTMSGILLLLGGLLLCKLVDRKSAGEYLYINPFWTAVVYLVLWFGLTLYVVLSST